MRLDVKAVLDPVPLHTTRPSLRQDSRHGDTRAVDEQCPQLSLGLETWGTVQLSDNLTIAHVRTCFCKFAFVKLPLSCTVHYNYALIVAHVCKYSLA